MSDESIDYLGSLEIYGSASANLFDLTGIKSYSLTPTFFLGEGNDTFNGADLAELINGDGGSDRFNSFGGNDTLDGGVGNDNLNGGAGSDNLLSGTGNDTLIGGAGQDRLTGGAGRDVFEFISMRDMTARDKTTDVITDFRRGQDKIDRLISMPARF